MTCGREGCEIHSQPHRFLFSLNDTDFLSLKEKYCAHDSSSMFGFPFFG